MRKLLSRASNQTLAGLLIITMSASAYGVVWYRDTAAEDVLLGLAQKHLDDYLRSDPNPNEWQGVTTLSVAREFGVFGKRRALLHIFIRNINPDAAPEKKFRGFEYYYSYADGKWVNTGSASCTAKEHFGEGLKIFAELDRTGGSFLEPTFATAHKANVANAVQPGVTTAVDKGVDE